MNEKKLIRKEMKSILSSFSEYDHLVKSKEISLRLGTLLSFLINSDSKFKTIGAFSPMRDEEPCFFCEFGLDLSDRLAFVDLRDLQSKDLIFRKASPDELEANKKFGVELYAPPEKNPVVQPDVLIVPALAFDKNGYRLGRGGGYYDRYLEKYTGITVGVCYSEQLLDVVPIEVHDAQVDYVVSDIETLRIR